MSALTARDNSSVRAALRLEPGAPVDLAAIDPGGRPIGPAEKAAAADELHEIADELEDLQEALYAEGVVGRGRRRVLLVLQGMDTSGKGGTVKRIAGMVNPQGIHLAAFGKPTRTELRHHFLWRIRKQVPKPGIIGVFDRSYYEDVLVVRVEKLLPAAQWRPRFAEINAFEAELAADGVSIVKCFLHISREEQRERLLARLDNPAKRWKYDPGDLTVRAKWDAYQKAYVDVLRRCASEAAPWYVVPSDRKWYRNWAVTRILLETLCELDPRFPQPTFDVDAERAALLADAPADPRR